MKKLKQYIFKSREKKHLAQNTREKRFVTYEKAKNIILLFESDYMEKNPFIKRVIEHLKAEGKKVNAFGYVNKKEIGSAILPDYKILNKKSCDWTELPAQSFLRELEENEYDLLIDLTTNDILPLKYILLYSNAACKAGTNKYDENLLDFKLQIPQDENVSADTEKTGGRNRKHAK
ncbi:MAG: hypothetical protein QM751_04405 [Paludibacteraceae bacterium]